MWSDGGLARQQHACAVTNPPGQNKELKERQAVAVSLEQYALRNVASITRVLGKKRTTRFYYCDSAHHQLSRTARSAHSQLKPGLAGASAHPERIMRCITTPRGTSNSPLRAPLGACNAARSTSSFSPSLPPHTSETFPPFRFLLQSTFFVVDRREGGRGGFRWKWIGFY